MFTIILSLVFILVTIAFLYFLECIRKSQYWSKRGIPSPKGEIIYGHLNAIINPAYPGVLQIRDWTKQFGKVYGIREGWRQVLIISDLDMIYEMLVKKFDCFYGRKIFAFQYNPDKDPRGDVFNTRGSRWKRLRNIAAPTSSIINLKKILPIIDDSVNVFISHLNKATTSNQPFNIHPYFRELTFDVISRITLGQEDSKQFENPDLKVLKELVDSIFVYKTHILAHLFPWDWSVYALNYIEDLKSKLKKNAGFTFFHQLYVAVEERKRLRAEGKVARDGGRIDFIDLLLDVENNESVVEEKEDFHVKSTIKLTKQLTTEEIIGMCTVFLFAGFDTTANTLANIVYFLAKNPEKQKILQKEIDQICNDETITYEQIQGLKYADAVMKEAQRLIPIAGFVVSRECMETTTLGNITIEKGTLIQADVYSVHHDKEIWGDDANEFVPERFLTNEPRHPAAFLSFGGGPRICLGVRLAQLEDKLALVRILKEFDIIECDQTEKELQMVGLGVLQPVSVTIKLRKREV